MNKFSLSRGNALPQCVTADKKKYEIDPSFRTVLKCLRAFGDKELIERDRTAVIAKLFYKGIVPENFLKPFFDFVAMGESGAGNTGIKDFDYEFDAKEIYSSFWQMYGIDLFGTDLHWWKFQALLHGAFSADTPLAHKVQLRHVDDSDGAKKASLDRAKKSVKIKECGSSAEENLQELIRKRLQNGEAINDLMR